MRDVAREFEQNTGTSVPSLYDDSLFSEKSEKTAGGSLAWLPKVDIGREPEDVHKPKGIFTLAAGAAADKTAAPESHTMSSRIFSWGWTFDIYDSAGKSEGIVDQKIFNLRKTFEYKDENGQTKAKGQERLLSWGTKIDVYDEKGTSIGGIQEHVFQSWWKPHTVYSIVDAQGKELAKSEKLEFFATNFKLTNEKGETVAKIHRPWLNFVRDNWTIDIVKPDEVDKRILYMIPAYKTSADADRRAAESSDSSSSSSKSNSGSRSK